MGILIEVESENRNYIKLLDLENPRKTEKIINLTTLKDNQTRVKIRIFINMDGRRTLLRELDIKNLKPAPSGKPRFRLKSSIDKKVLYLDLAVDGRRTGTYEISLKKILGNKRVFLIPLIILAVLILLFAGFKLIQNFRSSGTAYRVNTEESTPYGRTTSTVSPENRINSAGKTETASGTGKSYNPAQEPVSTAAGTGSSGYSAEATGGQQLPEKGPSEKPVSDSSLSEEKAGDINKESPDNTVSAISTDSQENREERKPVPPSVTADRRVYFSPNSIILNSEAKKELREIAENLSSYPNLKVVISGHCAMSGTEEGRESLSKDRAETVYNFLVSEGWNPLKEPVIEWHGGKLPVTNDPEKVYLNRRVEIRVQS